MPKNCLAQSFSMAVNAVSSQNPSQLWVNGSKNSQESSDCHHDDAKSQTPLGSTAYQTEQIMTLEVENSTIQYKALTSWYCGRWIPRKESAADWELPNSNNTWEANSCPVPHDFCQFAPMNTVWIVMNGYVQSMSSRPFTMAKWIYSATWKLVPSSPTRIRLVY